MSIMADFGSSIFQAVTGQDPNAVASQLTQAEQQLTLVAEAIVALLFLLVVGEFFIIVELRK